MEFFDIRFETPEGARTEGVGVGEVRLGEFRERFESDLSDWDEGAYQRQWDAAAARIISRDKAVFVTTYAPQSSAHFVRCWAVYREGERLFVQEQLLFLDELPGPFDPNSPEEYLGDRETYSDDGKLISEWTLGAEAMMDFIARRRAAATSR